MFLRATLFALMVCAVCSAQNAQSATASEKPEPSAAKSPQKVSDRSSGCHGLDGGELHKSLSNGYALNIRPASDDMEALCWAEILDSSGRQALGLNNYAVGLHNASGKDIDGDGQPDVIVEATTGGHCCWNYAIISLNPFHKQAQISNERPLNFVETKNGIVISTQDGIFDFFQGSASYSPRADVFLRLKGSSLRDVSSDFRDEYDQQIADARKKLSPQALEQFRTSGPKPDNAEVHAAILTIVLEYLYSGREEAAWKAFDSMWPESTREKTRKLILDTKARGVLTSVDRDSGNGSAVPKGEASPTGEKKFFARKVSTVPSAIPGCLSCAPVTLPVQPRERSHEKEGK